ncbi:MAG: hypothetical protein FGM26_02845 [Beijerinckiaceae bacterium]|nr:hypothetical protein [Beijerinckiaceae bacterium]
MSTTTRPSRGKPVTLAKSASGEPVPTKAAKAAKVSKPASRSAEKIEKTAKPVSTASSTPTIAAATSHPETLATGDFAFQAKWNELVKAQSEAALAWWQDAKDAKTFVDALAVNARHTRLQFEIAASQAREMADLVQKSFEGNAERLRSFLGPLSTGR